MSLSNKICILLSLTLFPLFLTTGLVWAQDTTCRGGAGGTLSTGVNSGTYPEYYGIGSYTNNVTCGPSSTYTCPSGSTTKIYIWYDTESSYDLVKIYNGAGTLLENISGLGGYVWKGPYSSNTLKFGFTSDSSVTKTGFDIWKIECIAAAVSCTSNPAGCDSVLDCANGSKCDCYEECTNPWCWGSAADFYTCSSVCAADGKYAPTASECCNSWNSTTKQCYTAASCASNPAGCDSVLDCANGTVCHCGDECSTGNCVDGYCCNSACSGLCQACNIAGSVGTCTSIPVGTDPIGECTASGCSNTGNCNGSGACETPGVGTDPNSYCGAIDCDGGTTKYYWGWSSDTCYYRDDVSAADAHCDGSSSCKSTATECGEEPQGASTGVSYNSSCRSGCSGTTAPAAANNGSVCGSDLGPGCRYTNTCDAWYYKNTCSSGSCTGATAWTTDATDNSACAGQTCAAGKVCNTAGSCVFSTTCNTRTTTSDTATLSPTTGWQTTSSSLASGTDTKRYAVNVTTTGNHEFSLCSNPADGGTANYDAYLCLFNSSGTSLATDDDSCSTPDNAPKITYNITATGTYYVQVSGYGSAYGSYTLAYRRTLPCSAPTIPTSSCSERTGSQIKFSWNAVSGATSYRAEWCNASYDFGNANCCPAGATCYSVTSNTYATATNLTVGTAYKFRTRVESATTCGAPGAWSSVTQCATTAQDQIDCENECYRRGYPGYPGGECYIATPPPPFTVWICNGYTYVDDIFHVGQCTHEWYQTQVHCACCHNCSPTPISDSATITPCAITIRTRGYDNTDNTIGGYRGFNKDTNWREVFMDDSTNTTIWDTCAENLRVKNTWSSSGDQLTITTEGDRLGTTTNTMLGGYDISVSGTGCYGFRRLGYTECLASATGVWVTTNDQTDSRTYDMEYCGDGECNCGETASTCCSDCCVPSACIPPVSGDWQIDVNCILETTNGDLRIKEGAMVVQTYPGTHTVTINGNINIQNNGILDLRGDSRINFSGSPRYIYIVPGGKLYQSSTSGINK